MRRVSSVGLRNTFELRTSAVQTARILERNELGPVGVRHYPGNLKELRLRLVAIKNIKKITSTMKMIAAAKLNKAQAVLFKTRPYAESSQRFLQEFFPSPQEGEPNPAEEAGKHLIVAITSDRGLCGGVNSSIIKASAAVMRNHAENTQLFLIGEKAKAALQREYGNSIVYAVSEVGANKRSSFTEVAQVAELIARQPADNVTVCYNHFNSVLSFTTTRKVFPAPKAFVESERRFSAYEFEGSHEEILADYWQFTLASQLFSALAESQTAEVATRMTSMDNATKNASEVLSKLTIKYNRTRQAAITTELTEIVSGAAAIEEASA
jgi:ATP synthase F1 gamma subunit